MKENSITIKRINSMSIDDKKKHKEKLKGQKLYFDFYDQKPLI